MLPSGQAEFFGRTHLYGFEREVLSVKQRNSQELKLLYIYILDS